MDQLVQANKGRFDQPEQQHQDLIKHAQDKLDLVEGQQYSFLEGAKALFAALESRHEALIADGSQRFVALEATCARLESLASIVANMQDAGLAESGVRGGRDSGQSISEYQASSDLEHHTGEGRLGYKAWTRKLETAI